jgi:predicted NAD/FAD-binding protein
MPSPLYALAEYDHPIADLKYFETQKALSAVQGNHHLWFAGNYTHDNDSHESAIVSAIKIARQLAPLSQRLMQITSIDRRESLEEPSDQKEHSSLETRSQSAI